MRKKIVWIVLILVFFELSSTLVLHGILGKERYQRFKDVYLEQKIEILPHPHLQYITEKVAQELKRYNSYDGDKIRIAAFGGSTTESGYPEITQEYLDAHSEKDYIVYNFGVGGWTSRHSLDLYMNYLRYDPPDIAIIHHVLNDAQVRSTESKAFIPPDIYTAEKIVLKVSRFARLIKASYILVRFKTYDQSLYSDSTPISVRIGNHIFGQTNVIMSEAFFVKYPDAELDRTLDLDDRAKTIKDFARYLNTDGVDVLLTTMYLNTTPYTGTNWKSKGAIDIINEDIRRFSSGENFYIVDLEKEMTGHSDLFIDFCHFNETGIRIKGELIAEGILAIEKNR